MFPFPLYLITDPLLYPLPKEGDHRDRSQSLVDVIEQAIEAGARLIQYRDKTGTRREMYERAKKLRGLTSARDVTLIINDEIDLALAVKADGVHLGQDDLPIDVARKLLAKGTIVGISTHNISQAAKAESEGADYIGFGPIFKSSTKDSSNVPLGIESVREAVRQVQIPIYVIGGIQFSHLPEVMAAGAAGVAAVSAFSGDIRLNVSRWVTFLKAKGNLDKTG